MNLHDLSFDKSWTLFLDRDGVINRRIVGGYVTRWEEFEFLAGARDALRIVSGVFGKVIVVTNQQGVGKGLLKTEDVNRINDQMVREIASAGGRIDRVFFSPHLEKMNHPDRKPGNGMAIKAVKNFPEIEFSKSVMVGDSISDMQFGRNIGAVNIWISHTGEDPIQEKLYDFKFASLYEFAKELKI